MVRTADKKSPREAVEFILQLLKYNDNNGNPYSDVFWLASMVQSVGELEFEQQSIEHLASLLKRLDRLLQFDRLMPSYNGVLTISCIRTLTQIALKLSDFIPLDRVIELIKPFQNFKAMWHVRIEAYRALLDLEIQSSGINAALVLFMKYLDEESSLRGQVKLGVHALRLCQMRNGSNPDTDVKTETLVALLRLLESPVSFNNVILRHYLFCILQVLAGRVPTLYGVPRDETLRMGHAETCSELKNIFAALVKQSKPPEPSEGAVNLAHDGSAILDMFQEPGILSNGHDWKEPVEAGGSDGLIIPEVNKETAAPFVVDQQQQNGVAHQAGDSLVLPESSKELRHESLEPSKEVDNVQNDNLVTIDASRERYTPSNSNEQVKHVEVLRDTSGNAHEPTTNSHEQEEEGDHLIQTCTVPGTSKEPDTVSNNPERKKPVFRIKVKKSAASSRAEDTAMMDKSLDAHADADRRASSSVSVDAPQRNFGETASTANQALQNLEDVNSCHDVGSRVTASIGSAKLPTDGDELQRELQCTADSGKVSSIPPTGEHISKSNIKEEEDHLEKAVEKYVSLQSLSVTGSYHDKGLGKDKERRDKKKDKEKKRKREHKERKGHRNDPEYLEKKRLKKEKKRKEKELAKLMKEEPKASSRVELQSKKDRSPSVGPATTVVSREHERRTEGMDSRSAAAAAASISSAPVELHNATEEPGKFLSGMQPNISVGKGAINREENSSAAQTQTQNSSSQKLKIRFKKRTLEKQS